MTDLKLMVAKLNVERYRRRLAVEAEPAMRARLQQLLDEEEAQVSLLSRTRSGDGLD